MVGVDVEKGQVQMLTWVDNPGSFPTRSDSEE